MSDNSTAYPPRPVVLCILDGWGDGVTSDTNAIAMTETPVWDHLVAQSPHARLNASEGDVGLPDGQMGNSEVGHMNIGAGRVVLHDLPRINACIAAGELATQPTFEAMIKSLQETGGTCHLMGLLSPGGVHSHQDHMAELVRIISSAGVPVAIHAFLDGRDTPPSTGAGYVEQFLNDIAGADNASIATVCGRFFAMDRDYRWDRVSRACAAIMDGDGDSADDAVSSITAAYEAGSTDEFIQPIVLGGYAGMRDGDGLLMANFRVDRAREILSAMVDPDFDGFERPRQVNFAARLGMVEYSDALNEFIDAMFHSLELDNILGEVVANAGLRQLRIAETEKYAHVTFFLNGGREDEYAGEDRILIPSPRVPTYDLQPEMSAPEVTDNLVRVIGEGTYDLIIVNFANGDMVGHTGILPAVCKAVETLDHSLGQLEQAVSEAGGVLMITADHGNCESMTDASGQPHTAHTLNPVPVVLVNAPDGVSGLHDGSLSDIAPTLLELLGIEQPLEMTGQSLIDR